jgi:glutathione S-transferase
MNTLISQQATNKQSPILLFRNPKSGHSHRVELMLSLLELPYQTIDVDMANGAHKAAEFLTMNPFGQVPAINDNGVTLGDSNSILVYLANKYDDKNQWNSQDPVKAAHIQRWLSVAAGEVAFGPALARLAKVFGANVDHELASSKAVSLFEIIDNFLAGRKTLLGDDYTIADIACYSYIAHAPEGGVSLAKFSNIGRWLDGVESLDHFIAMVSSPDLAA